MHRIENKHCTSCKFFDCQGCCSIIQMATMDVIVLRTLELLSLKLRAAKNITQNNISKEILLDLRQKCRRTQSGKKARLHLRWEEGARHARSTLARNAPLQSSSAAAPPSSAFWNGIAINPFVAAYQLMVCFTQGQSAAFIEIWITKQFVKARNRCILDELQQLTSLKDPRVVPWIWS